MGITVRKGRSKKGPEFELALDETKDGKRSFSRIPKEQWERYGFTFDMSLEEAKERGEQIRSQKKLDAEISARAKITKELKKEHMIKSAYLPSLLVREFESKLRDDFYGEDEDFLRSKKMSHWRAAMKVIAKAKVKPSDYEERRRVFYGIFLANEWSLSYCEKIIIIINKWGKHISKKQGKYCEKLPMPRDREKQRIIDTYDDSDKTSKESKPLTKSLLEKHEGKFKPEQSIWLSVSFFFGLRPGEVDNLNKERGKFWDIEEDDEVTVLAIYMPKLTNIPKAKRWKRIPCILPEQQNLIQYIEDETFEIKTPLVKTIKRYFGEGYTRYAGRKGFERLLESRNIPFDIRSVWLGHQSVDRTYKSYKDKSKAILPP